MPYITQKARDRFDGIVEAFDRDHADTPGELNYIITQLLLTKKPCSYSAFNELIGVLECVKLELYRRMAAPLEDRKCQENGDVYND